MINEKVALQLIKWLGKKKFQFDGDYWWKMEKQNRQLKEIRLTHKELYQKYLEENNVVE